MSNWLSDELLPPPMLQLRDKRRREEMAERGYPYDARDFRCYGRVVHPPARGAGMARIELSELTKIAHLQAIAAREATRCITAALAETGGPELRQSLHRKFLLAASGLDRASPVIGEHLRELADLVETVGNCLDERVDAIVELPR
jgi:hypothetical protein